MNTYNQDQGLRHSEKRETRPGEAIYAQEHSPGSHKDEKAPH